MLQAFADTGAFNERLAPPTAESFVAAAER
jgi:hypothetical protein